MKDKEKQIEKMANIICDRCMKVNKESSCPYYENKSCFENRKKEATYYYEQGYRKIDKDSVVLSREEFDKLGLVIETVQEYKSDEKGRPILVKERKIVKKLQNSMVDLLNQEIRELQIATQVGKETAEKFYNTIIYWILALNFETENKDYDEGFFDACKEIIRRIDHIAKKFGIETKE